MENKVPSFSGFTDGRTAQAWVTRAQSCKLQYGWSDQQFLEACISAMVKEAEEWVQANRTARLDNSPNCLGSIDDFIKGFLDTYAKPYRYTEEVHDITTLRQQAGEQVKAFYIRVQKRIGEYTHDFYEEVNWNIQVPDGAGTPGNDKYYRQQGIQEFANRRLRDTFFLMGLKPLLQRAVKAGLDQMKKTNTTMLESALTAERTFGNQATLQSTQILAINGPQQFSPRGRSAFSTGRGSRNSSGSRGSSSSRGRGLPYQPSNQLNRESGQDKLARIRNRTKPVLCRRCHQWGKHYANECRRPWNQVAALDFMDPNAKPKGQAYDDYYDQLTQWPGDALPMDPPGEGHNSAEVVEATAAAQQGN